MPPGWDEEGRWPAGTFGAPALNPQFRFHRAELLDGEGEVLARMGGADLRADARFALRDDGVEKADDIHAAREHGLGETLCERRIAEHDGDDGMRARQDVEAAHDHLGAEKFRVRFELVAEVGGGGEKVEHGERAADDRGRERVGKKVRPRALAE